MEKVLLRKKVVFHLFLVFVGILSLSTSSLSQTGLQQLNEHRKQAGLMPLTGDPQWDIVIVTTECFKQGIEGSCKLIEPIEAACEKKCAQEWHGDSWQYFQCIGLCSPVVTGPSTNRPPMGRSSSQPSPAACLTRCSNAWINCNKACRFAPSLDDEDIMRKRACFDQCDSEKSACEARCR